MRATACTEYATARIGCQGFFFRAVGLYGISSVCALVTHSRERVGLMKTNKRKDPAAVRLGKLRWKGKTAEERRESARKAARARWGKGKK